MAVGALKTGFTIDARLVKVYNWTNTYPLYGFHTATVDWGSLQTGVTGLCSLKQRETNKNRNITGSIDWISSYEIPVEYQTHKLTYNTQHRINACVV